jgi:hypothetical protein
MIRGILTTPRPIPSRRIPAAGGTLVVLLALPVFAAAGWSLGAWALAASLWLASEVLAFFLGRIPIGLDRLASSGVVSVAMTFRVIAIMVVLIAVAASNEGLAVPAAAVFIVAYSFELALSLVLYFTGTR